MSEGQRASDEVYTPERLYQVLDFCVNSIYFLIKEIIFPDVFVLPSTCCLGVRLYSPTIWPLTVSLSLGLSLFKSSLWSVERGQKEEVERAQTQR